MVYLGTGLKVGSSGIWLQVNGIHLTKFLLHQYLESRNQFLVEVLSFLLDDEPKRKNNN